MNRAAVKRAKGRKRRNERYGLHPQSALVLFRGDRFVTILQFPFSIIFVIPGSIRKYDVVILPNRNPCSISKFFRFRVFGDFVILTLYAIVSYLRSGSRGTISPLLES